jgi:hypothetical protein
VGCDLRALTRETARRSDFVAELKMATGNDARALTGMFYVLI